MSKKEIENKLGINSDYKCICGNYMIQYELDNYGECSECVNRKTPEWVDLWYDRHVRSWCVQVKNRLGEQLEDESTYVYSKPEALEIEKEKLVQYGLNKHNSRMKQKEYKEMLKE